MVEKKDIIQTKKLNLWYGEKQALIDVTMKIVHLYVPFVILV